MWTLIPALFLSVLAQLFVGSTNHMMKLTLPKKRQKKPYKRPNFSGFLIHFSSMIQFALYQWKNYVSRSSRGSCYSVRAGGVNPLGGPLPEFGKVFALSNVALEDIILF